MVTKEGNPESRCNPPKTHQRHTSDTPKTHQRHTKANTTSKHKKRGVILADTHAVHAYAVHTYALPTNNSNRPGKPQPSEQPPPCPPLLPRLRGGARRFGRNNQSTTARVTNSNFLGYFSWRMLQCSQRCTCLAVEVFRCLGCWRSVQLRRNG